MTAIAGLHDFLDGLPAAVTAAINAASNTRQWQAEDRLQTAGKRTLEVHQLLDGQVKYSATDHRGREMVLTYMGPGDWVGLSEVFSDLPALWSVVATTAVHTRSIRCRDFEQLVDSHPILARHLLRTFALRFSLHRLFGLDHSALSLKERLVKMLYFLSYRHDRQGSDSEPVLMKLSQEELGKVVGASRQKLNPALKALEKEGLLDVHFGSLTLRSRAAIVARYGHLLDAR